LPFSSINFLVLLPVLLLVYWLLPTAAKRIWLLVASLIVYLAAGWGDLLLLIAATSANWLSSAAFPRSRLAPKAMIVADILVLGWFKYRYFVAGMVGEGGAGSLIIPLGISFYTFQLISYQVELLRGIVTRRPTFFAFFLYIFFFPHHQAGPIMRPHRFLGAFVKGRKWSSARFRIGVMIFLWGLFKKIWIADWLMGDFVAQSFRQLHQSGGGQGNALLLGVVYGIQIYADFSGYSDIAVGLGRMFGFKLDRNFHQPYIAVGPSEFWRRWHVTLSRWLRDHVYIPLGGNRGSTWRTPANLMAVMLIAGLWHGAGWNFVVWGGLHGSYLVAERLGGRWLEKVAPLKFIVFQALFMLAWIPFRESDLRTVWTLFSRGDAWVSVQTVFAALLGFGIVVFSWLENRLEGTFPRLGLRWRRLPDAVFALACSFALLAVLSGVRHEAVFIYQRF
jgi:alginate O-acetyltransferase complex protein AlgI